MEKYYKKFFPTRINYATNKHVNTSKRKRQKERKEVWGREQKKILPHTLISQKTIKKVKCLQIISEKDAANGNKHEKPVNKTRKKKSIER